MPDLEKDGPSSIKIDNRKSKTLPAPAEPRSNRIVLAVCCYCLLTASFVAIGPATCLIDISADLDMNLDTSKGLFLSGPFWALTCMILASGWFADRLSFKTLLVASTVLQSTGLMLVSMADHMWIAVAGAVLGGAGRGMIMAPLNSVICLLYPECRARMMNLLHGFFHVGMVLSISLVLVLMHFGWSWQWIFRLLAMPPLSCGALALALPLPPMASASPLRARVKTGTGCVSDQVGDAEVDIDKVPVPIISQPLTGTENASANADGQGEPQRLPLRWFFGQRTFRWLLLALFGCGITELGPMNWLAYFITQTGQTTRMAGATGLLFFGLLMACGRFGASALVNRVGPKTVFLGFGLVSSVSLVLAAVFVDPMLTIFFLCVLGLGVSAAFPTIVGFAGDYFPQGGASMYALLAAASTFGGVVGPMGIGLAADGIGIRHAMVVLAVVPLMAMALLLRVK